MSPSLLTTKPVPSACSVRTETTAGVERAAISAGVRNAGADDLGSRAGSALGAATGLGLHESDAARHVQRRVTRRVDTIFAQLTIFGGKVHVRAFRALVYSVARPTDVTRNP